jgi:hypothetical protein
LLAIDPALDLFAPRVHQDFFRRLYDARPLDANGVQGARAERAFRDVAERFRMIADGSADVVVPWGDGEQALAALRRDGPDRVRLRRLQRFVVRVPASLHRRLTEAGALEEVADAVTALRWSHRTLYTERFGLLAGDTVAADADAFVV